MAERMPLLQTPVQESLLAAVRAGAERQFTTMSGYVRRALLAQLRADGVLPSRITTPPTPTHEGRLP
jgi:hypothetical protein